MFRYERAKILPFFLQKKMTVAELARAAGVSHKSAQRAVNGEAVHAVVIGKVADALGIDAMEFLDGGKHTTTKKTVTIIRDDGTTKEVEIFVDDSGKMFAAWGTDEEIQKAFASAERGSADVI